MEATDDLRLLAYSVDVGRVRALELGPGYTREHDLGESLALLDGFDAVQRELGSPAALSRPTLAAVERRRAGLDGGAAEDVGRLLGIGGPSEMRHDR